MNSTATNGMCYQGKSGELNLSAFYEADWGSNKDNRRSTPEVMVMINNSQIVIKSILQNSVSLSTAEAEYVARSLCVQKVLWVKNLLLEMKIKTDSQVIVHEDNQSAIAIEKMKGSKLCQAH